MAELSTGDTAAMRIEWMRIVLLAAVASLAESKGDAATELRRMERVIKRGMDAASFRQIGAMDRDMVKHAALQEIERFFREALALVGTPPEPRADR